MSLLWVTSWWTIASYFFFYSDEDTWQERHVFSLSEPFDSFIRLVHPILSSLGHNLDHVHHGPELHTVMGETLRRAYVSVLSSALAGCVFVCVRASMHVLVKALLAVSCLPCAGDSWPEEHRGHSSPLCEGECCIPLTMHYCVPLQLGMPISTRFLKEALTTCYCCGVCSLVVVEMLIVLCVCLVRVGRSVSPHNCSDMRAALFSFLNNPLPICMGVLCVPMYSS